VAVGAGATAECMVVRVVVRERTDGAGDENVLSAPLPELTPPTVALVAPPDDAAWEGAASECATSGSVEFVCAIDLFPMVGGGWSSSDRMECLLCCNEDVLIELLVGFVEKESWPFPNVAVFPFVSPFPFTRPDSGYGLLFLDAACFFCFKGYVFRLLVG